jgi:hypothetical protein
LNIGETRIPLLVVYDETYLPFNQFSQEKILINIYTFIKEMMHSKGYPAIIKEVVCVPFDFELKRDNPAILDAPSVKRFEKQLKNCLKWLAEHTSEEPTIYSHSIIDLFDNALDSHFSKILTPYYTLYRTQRETWDGNQRDTVAIPPFPLLEFISHYNAVCENVCKSISNYADAMYHVSWPVPEFQKEYSSKIENSLNMLRKNLQFLPLPRFSTNSTEINTNKYSQIKSTFKQIKEYMICIREYHMKGVNTSQISGPDMLLFAANIMNILKKLYLRKSNKITEALVIIKYNQIFEQIILFHFECLSLSIGNDTVLYSPVSYDIISNEIVEQVKNLDEEQKLPSIEEKIYHVLSNQVLKLMRDAQNQLENSKGPNISATTLQSKSSHMTPTATLPHKRLISESIAPESKSNDEEKDVTMKKQSKKPKTTPFFDDSAFWSQLKQESEKQKDFNHFLKEYEEPGSYILMEEENSLLYDLELPIEELNLIDDEELDQLTKE